MLRNIVARPLLVFSQSHRPNFGLASRAVTTAPGESGSDVGIMTVKHLPCLSAGTTDTRATRAHCMKQGVEGEVSVVYVTVPAPGANDVAKTLASSIIENKLAACVNIVPGLHDLYAICLYFYGRRHIGSHMSTFCKSVLTQPASKLYQRCHCRCDICLLVGGQS